MATHTVASAIPFSHLQTTASPDESFPSRENALPAFVPASSGSIAMDVFTTIAYGDGQKAITHDLGATAIAIGEDVEAHALGKYGTAITIGGTCGETRMAAGLHGKLIWIMPWDGGGQHTCSAEVDGVRIKPGRLYTADFYGKFVEVDNCDKRPIE